MLFQRVPSLFGGVFSSRTMKQHLFRYQVIPYHLLASRSTSSVPFITVDPPISLVDQKVSIVIHALKPHQTVTLVTKIEGHKHQFESRCVMKADVNGTICNGHSPSLSGTFTGIQPMGLFWSTTSNPSVPFLHKDVSAPISYALNVYDGVQAENFTETTDCLATTKVLRFFKKPRIRRLPLKDGTFQGAIFLPGGDGPFPALIDLHGAMVGRNETRAALLASHGYATFAMCYLYGDGLAPTAYSVDADYIHEAAMWFHKKDFVDKKRFGVIGNCFGGMLTLYLTSVYPEIKALVNVNPIPIHSGKHANAKVSINSDEWPRSNLVYSCDEGVILKDAFEDDNPVCIPAWQHGTKILHIAGDDDMQVDPKWHRLFGRNCPEQWRSNFELVTYPGAGHYIDLPYMPFFRASNIGKRLTSTVEFVPAEFQDEPIMSGGNLRQHAYAQQDSWDRILIFLDKNLKRRK